MINGTHILFYSTNAEADRAFLRDVLELRNVDAGGGWLIFAMPPAEAAVHPADESTTASRTDGNFFRAHVYFMCDDVRAMVRLLEEKKVKCEPLGHERWGIRTAITLPSGGQIGLYQPTHPTALDLK